MERIGHFKERDAKRIGAFFRRRGDRKEARPKRPRRRIYSDGQIIKFGKMANELEFGQTGTLNVYRNGENTGETIEVVWDLFRGDGETITPALDVGAMWIADEKLWRLLFVDCENTERENNGTV